MARIMTIIARYGHDPSHRQKRILGHRDMFFGNLYHSLSLTKIITYVILGDALAYFKKVV